VEPEGGASSAESPHGVAARRLRVAAAVEEAWRGEALRGQGREGGGG